MAMILDQDVKKLLACPKCGGSVQSSNAQVRCAECRLTFPVRRGIPVMLTEAATNGEQSSEYSNYMKTSTESIEFYDTFYKDLNDYRRYEKADIDFVDRIFRKLDLPPQALVMDIGSGTGYFHSLIEELTDHKVISADFSVEGFRTATQHYGLKNLVVMDAYESALQPNSLDAVFAIGLTPFKKSDQQDIVHLIEQIAKPIRPGGYFVFVWSTNLSGKTQKTTVQTDDWKDQVTWYYNHSRKMIRNAFQQTGQFGEIQDYAFIRPLSHVLGRLTLTRINTILTEALMKVTPSNLSARLLVIGQKKGNVVVNHSASKTAAA